MDKAVYAVEAQVEETHWWFVGRRRLVSRLLEELGVSRDEVVPRASFIDDLGADSLDIVELVMCLEEEFDIEIPDDDAEKIQTIGDAISYLKERLES